MLLDDIKTGETDVLEFKRDIPDDHLKFLKTAVAFANCNGGRIVFGISVTFRLWRPSNLTADQKNRPEKPVRKTARKTLIVYWNS